MINQLYRRILLGVAERSVVEDFVKRHGDIFGVSRFIAGDEKQAAVASLQQLEQANFHSILNFVGEHIQSIDEAHQNAAELFALLEILQASGLQRWHLGVKPSQLGLGLDDALALDYAQQLAQKVKAAGSQLCFDMEDTPYVDSTLELIRQLHAQGHHHVGTVLQSYLHRTPDDLQGLLELQPAPSLRLVKGAYKEAASVAYQDKAKVDEQLLELALTGLEAGAHINFGSHDEALITGLKHYIRGAKLPSEGYEFQLLYGVKPKLQQKLRDEGHNVRLYVPYGQDWYAYFARRLAERPANLLFVARGLVG